MRSNWSHTRRSIVGAVSLHVLALGLYVLPVAWVPEGLRVLTGAYARPLFHQQWRLFAPDPPMCSCEIEWSTDELEWRSIEAGHYLEERLIQNLARHAQAAFRAESGSVDPLLMDALRKAADEEDAEKVSFRLKEYCVIDAGTPGDREIRIIPIAS